MKNQSLRNLAGIAGSALISLALSVSAIAYPSGSPAGYTGSPGDTHHCVSCHGGSSAPVTGWITSNIPASGYTSGTVYTITATVSGSGKKGFEVSPQNAAGTQLGILAAGSNNHLVGGTKYVTQNSSGSSSATVIYNFSWTAPAAGTGIVTFYGAFTVGKSNTKLSTLDVIENTILPLTATASAAPAAICAGQSSQLNVVPSGGSGTYTYNWTSIPAGFTSSLPNPLVSPSVSTQYVAHVSDGTSLVDANASVTVTLPATAIAGNDTTCPFITAQVPLNGFATGYSSVQWTTSGTGTFSAASALAGDYFPSAADKNNGVVTLTLTTSAQSPCSVAATDSRIVNFEGPAGIESAQNSKMDFVISPNPTPGLFAIRASGLDEKNVIVTVSDIRGKTVVQQVLDVSGTQSVQFDLLGYARGLYLVSVKTTSSSVVHKLVVE